MALAYGMMFKPQYPSAVNRKIPGCSYILRVVTLEDIVIVRAIKGRVCCRRCIGVCLNMDTDTGVYMVNSAGTHIAPMVF